MKSNSVVRIVAIGAILAVILGAILPALASLSY